jgi:hypothetical protein
LSAAFGHHDQVRCRQRAKVLHVSDVGVRALGGQTGGGSVVEGGGQHRWVAVDQGGLGSRSGVVGEEVSCAAGQFGDVPGGRQEPT